MNRRKLLGGAGATGAALTTVHAVAQTVPAPAASAHLDAALLELGQRFEAAWKVEDAAWEAEPEYASADEERAQVLNRATAAIVAEIERTSAVSQAGLLVKMRAVLWCRAGAPPDAEMFEDPLHPEEHTTDVRLALAILTDLHAMAGGAT